MTLINKNPVGHIKVKDGEIIEIIHYSDGEKKPCIYCDELTTERELGSPVCSSCHEYNYSKCKKCKFGIEKSVFHCNGNDLEDHFSNYTACAMRDHDQKLRNSPNFKSMGSAWWVNPTERKKCFVPKNKKEEVI